jgi:hypothetical protein
MTYFGVDLLECRCSITALSEGFAVLDSREFYTKFNENNDISNWANSIKCQHKEKSYWYFDEQNFHRYFNNFNNFGFIKLFEEFFLVDHRRLINLHTFLNESLALWGDSFSIKFDMSHLLASSTRLFNCNDIKILASLSKCNGLRFL